MNDRDIADLLDRAGTQAKRARALIRQDQHELAARALRSADCLLELARSARLIRVVMTLPDNQPLDSQIALT